MYNKAVDNFSHTVKFVPDYFMTQKMCDKAVNTHLSTMQFASECYNTQEMCDKAVDRCILYLSLFLIGIKLKKV